METILAQKILDLDLQVLIDLLKKLENEDRDAYEALKDKIEDI